LLDESELRQVLESRLSRKDAAILERLNQKRREREITRAEERQRRALLRQHERAMLSRAAALAELHRPGLKNPHLTSQVVQRLTPGDCVGVSNTRRVTGADTACALSLSWGRRWRSST